MDDQFGFIILAKIQNEKQLIFSVINFLKLNFKSEL